MSDIHPDYYAKGPVDCYEAIDSALSLEAYEGFLVGNIIKYLWRYKDKNGVEDLKKADWYLDKLIYLNSVDECDSYGEEVEEIEF